MPRVSSRRSEASDGDLDGLEQDLLRLQQEYRVMDGDRKAYTEESQNIMRKQHQAIKTLQAENEELNKEFRLAGSEQNQTNDGKKVDRLSGLLKVEDEMNQQIEKAKAAIKRIEQVIHQTERKISQQRKNMGGVNMSLSKHITLQKQIRVLENRLDQGNLKFSQGLSENSKLREAIDHMRTERTIFQGLSIKLEKKLQGNKEDIAKLIEYSTAAYDARDDAQNKMSVLNERSDKDLLLYNTELKELMRIIDHDRKLKQFMRVKAEDRALVWNVDYTLPSKVERERNGDRDDTIQSYEEAFARIKEAVGIEDLRQLVGKFIETEDQNFALFNYVNEMNNETEHVQEKIVDLKNDTEKFNVENVCMDEDREKIKYGLEQEIASVERDIGTVVAEIKQSKQMLAKLKGGVKDVLDKIGCDTSAIVDMLGGHTGITEVNIMQHLGLIEQRANELLQAQAFVALQDEEQMLQRPETSNLIGRGALPLPAVTAVHPPGTWEEESETGGQSDDPDRPLTEAELKIRVAIGISKKEANQQRAGVENASGKKDRLHTVGMNDPLFDSSRKSSRRLHSKDK